MSVVWLGVDLTMTPNVQRDTCLKILDYMFSIQDLFRPQ